MVPLDDLLDRTAEALLSGDLATLGALTARMEDCVATASAPDQATANRWQSKALRNARLLEAASRGVKAARRRVVEIAQGPTLTTYDSRGQKASITPIGLEAARRA
jgi:hypothetical protein